MRCSIAIYPSVNWKQQVKEWDAYMDRACRQGFSEVFSTLHLPELSLAEQVEMLGELSGLVKCHGMELTADIGGEEIEELLANPSLCSRIREMGLDFLRLDYGFSIAQAKNMYECLGIRGFVINASLYSKTEVKKLINELKTIHSCMELRACHNYYPRPESGLDEKFFQNQNQIFSELGLDVYGCISGGSRLRGPLSLGLPTLERHRGMNLEQVSVELISSPGISGVMVSDEFFTEKELGVVHHAAEREPLTLKIYLDETISLMEKKLILNQNHHIRYDSNELILRSQTSREMSRIGRQIAPRLKYKRSRGMVTVDNVCFGRYSGEVQIVMGELPADDRINCCGWICEADMWKLQYFRRGYDYRFVEVS